MIGAPNTHGPSMTIISPCATTSRGSSGTPSRAARPATRYCMGGAVLRTIGPTSRPIEASSEGSALTGKLLVFDAVRDGRIRAQPAHLVGLVVLEVALEPFDVAVALEGQHVGRDAVEEPAVVADDDGAAGEILKRFFKRPQGVDVEIVGGLVEEQKIGAGFEHLGQMHAVALAAREPAHLLLLVGPLEVERRAIGARIDL